MKLHLHSWWLCFATAIAADYTPGAEPKCTDIKIPVHVTGENWDLPPYPNSTDVTSLVKYLSQSLPSSGFAQKPRVTVTGNFSIAATFCKPTNIVPGREKSVQFLVHGFGYTRSYWHGLGYPNSTFGGQFSWVHHAASLGYSTLSIDNLGNGESDHPDPIRVVQFPLQSKILLKIIQGLRTGDLSPHIPQSFSKVIMAAWSYGALHGRALAISNPKNAADVYILTATAWNIVGINTVVRTIAGGSARIKYPIQLGHLPPAYMTFDPSGLKDVMYPLDGQFDAQLVAFDKKFPHVFSVGEFASPKLNTTSNFTGPVMVLTGRNDAIACDSRGNNTEHVADCGIGGGSIPGQLAEVFPNAQFGVYIADKTGHNINLGYSASEAFGAAHGFLQFYGF